MQDKWPTPTAVLEYLMQPSLTQTLLPAAPRGGHMPEIVLCAKKPLAFRRICALDLGLAHFLAMAKLGKEVQQERGAERSLSVPGWLPSTTSRSMSPVSPVMFPPASDYFSKPAPSVDKPGKRLTPWEAAAKSPLGLVDDAFGPQTMQESIAANVVSAARRKTLPAPPEDWKQKVAYEHPAASAHAKLASFGRSHSATILPAKSTVSAPSSSAHCGSRLQYAYYGQRARTDPDMVSVGSRSDYSLSIADSNYNPQPKGWRRQT
ncbi:Synaptopodin-2 [Varanus komodoensis]|nr:Synaptopodin-2 [Varanus komodoensis]